MKQKQMGAINKMADKDMAVQGGMLCRDGH